MNKLISTIIFILILIGFFVKGCNLLSRNNEVKNLTSNVSINYFNSTINSSSSKEENYGTYLAAKEAYADVLAKYNKMQDAYNCIQLYKNIGGVDPKNNDEYRQALNSYPRLKSDYESALAAYKDTFPQYPLK